MKNVTKRLLSILTTLIMICTVYSPITSSATTELYWPLDTNHGITNAYTPSHGGADLACAAGTPIYAVTSGTATFYQAYTKIDGVNKLTSYGNYVTITSGSYTTLYAHMNSFVGVDLIIASSQTQQKSGSSGKHTLATRTVSEGEIIGYVGTTGNSTGNHLHFEVWINGVKQNPASYVSQSMSANEHAAHNPQGYLDSAIGGEGHVTVRGWAFDRDVINEAVEIHVYIGGPAGSGHVYGIGKADKERKDVNEAFGITGNHGFDTTFDVSESPGEYDIYVYAINMGEGTNNPLIGHSKVTVKAKHTHTYVENVVPATCTVDGEKTFTCSVCGDSYKESIKAIGHQYIDTIKPPTYTEDGYTLHTCSVCNDSYKDNEILPCGHVMEESEAAGQTISNGDYWIYNEHDMNYFLDVPGVEFSHYGANVQMWYDSSNMPSEFDVWTVTYLENGFYKIRQRGTNLCLDVSDASINRGANVQLSNDNSSFAQQWSISKTQHGYTLQARCSSYNLDVMDGKIESGTNVRTWSANDQKAQSFCFIPYSPDERPIEDGVYNIQSVCSDNYYLDISGERGEYQNNSNAQIWNGATDKFKIVYAGDGWYKIYEESTGLALEVNNDDDQKCFLHNERNIQLYENNESRGQFWKIRKTDDGHYFLISKLSGYYLDLLDGKCTDGQNVSQVYYIGGNPQKWNFIKVNTKGDLNDDGEFNISDLVLLQKWLLSVPDTELANWRAADLCEDGKLDAFDMIEMRKLLIQNPSLSAQ